VTFLPPTALLGLLALPVILLLHLLRSRRPERDFSSLVLWRGLERKRRGRLPRRLPLSFLLLLQLLVALGLTAALARPVLPTVREPESHTLFILDRTTSMAAQEDGTSRFDRARQLIEAHLEAMQDADGLTVVSLDTRPERLLSASGQQKEAARQALAALRPGATGQDLPAALSLAEGLLRGEPQSRIVILTDGAFDLDPATLPVMERPVSWQVIPSVASQAPANQALLSVSARRLPDGSQRIFGRIVNYSAAGAIGTLRAATEQGLLAEERVQLPPRGEVTRVWDVPEQARTATVEILEPDALALDNRAELFLAPLDRRRVLLVSETPDLLRRGLEAQPAVELVLASPTEPLPVPGQFDLIVLDGLPPDLTTWPQGNVLVVNPPLGHTLLPAAGYSRDLRPDEGGDSPLLAGVDLSGVYFTRAPVVEPPPWAQIDLLGYRAVQGSDQGGQPLILHGALGDSRLVVWAFDLAASNLPARLALPLLVANSLDLLFVPPLPAVVSLGERVALGGDLAVTGPDGVRGPSGSPGADVESAPGTIVASQPGLYTVYDGQGRVVTAFAAHAGSALESNLARRIDQAVLAWSGGAETAGEDERALDVRELWPWLGGLVLFFLVVEGWLAWRK
jgi:Ca-activated chloride channel family protein